MSSSGESGISAWTAAPSARPIAFVVDTTMSPAFSSRWTTSPKRRTSSDSAASTQQIVVDAQEHVLAVEHVDAAARVEQRPLQGARVLVLALLVLADEHHQRRAVAGALACASAAVTPPSTQLKSRRRASARRSRSSSLTAAMMMPPPATSYSSTMTKRPGRLAVRRQIERDRLLQSPASTSATSCRPTLSFSSRRVQLALASITLLILCEPHRHRRRAELQLVVAPGDERLLAQPDHVGLQARRHQRRLVDVAHHLAAGHVDLLGQREARSTSPPRCWCAARC